VLRSDVGSLLAELAGWEGWHGDEGASYEETSLEPNPNPHSTLLDDSERAKTLEGATANELTHLRWWARRPASPGSCKDSRDLCAEPCAEKLEFDGDERPARRKLSTSETTG